MDPAIYRKFMKLLQDEELSDPSWIRTLDEFDEPPLFSRHDQIEFLRSLTDEQKLIVTLEIALSNIELVANEAAQHVRERMFFVCVTFLYFESWRAGERLVPRTSIFVNPKDDEMGEPVFRMVEPWSEDAALVARALAQLGQNYTDRYCVGELSEGSVDPEYRRVYVGWRDNPAINVRSVGAEIRGL